MSRIIRQANSHDLIGKSGDRILVEYKSRNPGNLKTEENKKGQS